MLTKNVVFKKGSKFLSKIGLVTRDFFPTAWNDDLKKMGVDDSKALKEEQREELLDKIISAKENLGYAVHVLSPRFISTSMFKRVKYNLNTIRSVH